MQKIFSSLAAAMCVVAAASASAGGCDAETPIGSRIADCTTVIQNPSTEDSDMAMALTVRGLAHQELGNLRAAVEDLSRAVRIMPQEPQIRYYRAMALNAAGDPVAGIGDLDWIIDTYPEAYGAYISRCFLKSEAGDQWDAIEDCESALRIGPSLAAAYNNLALALYRAGAATAALNDIDVALGGAPDYWGFLDTRAHILVALDRKDEALTAFQRAAENGGAEAVGLYQAALRKKGYYEGGEDGQWSDDLQGAITQCVRDGCGLLAEAGTLPVLEKTDETDFVLGVFRDPIFGCFMSAGLAEDSVMLDEETSKTLITPDGSKITVIADNSGASHIVARDAAGLYAPGLSDAANDALAGCE